MSTTPSHIAGDLPDKFDISRLGNGLALEEIRQNYFVAAMMSENDDGSIGGITINQNGRKTSDFETKDKDKKAVDTLVLLAMLHDFEQTELRLAEKYGEDFAENLAAEHQIT